MAKVEIRFREYDDSGDIIDDGTWVETTFNSGTNNDVFRTWEYTVPAGLNGSYKIDLRATDSYGEQSTAENKLDPNSELPSNERYVPGVWSGRAGYEGRLTYFLPVVAAVKK